MEVTNMMEHQKLILMNVTSNAELFGKELKKSVEWLSPDDVRKLYLWVENLYGDMHRQVIASAFAARVF